MLPQTSEAKRLYREYGRPVYPGHPMVSAVYAMAHFDTAEQALAKSPNGQGWSCLVGSSAVPGAGCAAYAADRILRLVVNGGTVEQAIALADEHWAAVAMQRSHAAEVPEGQAQAEAMRPEFRRLLGKWVLR